MTILGSKFFEIFHIVGQSFEIFHIVGQSFFSESDIKDPDKIQKFP